MASHSFRLIAALSDAADPAIDQAIAARADAVLVPGGALPGGAQAIAGTLGRLREAGVPAIAEVDLEATLVEHLTADLLAERLLALGEVAGWRLAGVERIAGDTLDAVIARLHEAAPGREVIVGPLGGARGRAAGFARAGATAFVASYGWWNFTDAWLLDEIATLRAAGPVLAEVRAHHLRDADQATAAQRRLFAAATLGDGAVIPATALGDTGVVAGLRAAGGRACGYPGALSRLTGAGSPVVALLRTDAIDPRAADEALLVLINRADTEQPAPAPHVMLPVAGLPLRGLARAEGEGDPLAPLGGGEVRLLVARRARAITTAIKSGGKSARIAGEWPRLVVEDVQPAVTGGPFPVKRVVGERVDVTATVFGDGHEQLAAEIVWRAADDGEWSRVPMAQHPNDRWTGAFALPRLGRYEFAVEGWLDRFGGFRRDFGKKLDAGVAQPVDHAEGRALVAEAAARGADVGDWPVRLKAAGDGPESATLLLSPELAAVMDAADDRPHRIRSEPQIVDAERIEARFSSWYELFPRSMSGDKARHGTFADVIEHLPRVRDMGFDTLYFPPIHPIGRANRKGPNNTLTPGPDDPGSPYAIGSEAGGHDAVHPELGSFADFDRLVKAARDHGLEIALDFAIQCSPDHPWLKEHPGWFAWRPDGSMKYAENPPKKYQDIVNVDFYAPDAVPDLWIALRDVILLWIEHGVKTFRVDNPHTKTLPFWEWMIGEVRGQHPEAIFLAEAFTRPAMMYRLAKIGFSQSYTYFTWRDGKQELTDYIVELTTTAPKEFYRPHFFVNTPDINPIFLQTSGRPGFRIRAVLAATLSGLFGVYSGFELCEAAALPGKEEYLDSEKYELRPRDWNAPGNIVADITLLNRLRRVHPALQTHLNTRFYAAGNDRIIYYGKPEPDGAGMILVMVNLDPHTGQECQFEVPLWELGLDDGGTVAVEDLARGYRFDWTGKSQWIRLDTDEPYRIWRIAPKGAF